jgi:hypothetical protein
MVMKKNNGVGVFLRSRLPQDWKTNFELVKKKLAKASQ